VRCDALEWAAARSSFDGKVGIAVALVLAPVDGPELEEPEPSALVAVAAHARGALLQLHRLGDFGQGARSEPGLGLLRIRRRSGGRKREKGGWPSVVERHLEWESVEHSLIWWQRDSGKTQRIGGSDSADE